MIGVQSHVRGCNESSLQPLDLVQLRLFSNLVPTSMLIVNARYWYTARLSQVVRVSGHVCFAEYSIQVRRIYCSRDIHHSSHVVSFVLKQIQTYIFYFCVGRRRR